MKPKKCKFVEVQYEESTKDSNQQVQKQATHFQVISDQSSISIQQTEIPYKPRYRASEQLNPSQQYQQQQQEPKRNFKQTTNQIQYVESQYQQIPYGSQEQHIYRNEFRKPNVQNQQNMAQQQREQTMPQQKSEKIIIKEQNFVYEPKNEPIQRELFRNQTQQNIPQQQREQNIPQQRREKIVIQEQQFVYQPKNQLIQSELFSNQPNYKQRTDNRPNSQKYQQHQKKDKKQKKSNKNDYNEKKNKQKQPEQYQYEPRPYQNQVQKTGKLKNYKQQQQQQQQQQSDCTDDSDYSNQQSQSQFDSSTQQLPQFESERQLDYQYNQNQSHHPYQQHQNQNQFQQNTSPQQYIQSSINLQCQQPIQRQQKVQYNEDEDEDDDENNHNSELYPQQRPKHQETIGRRFIDNKRKEKYKEDMKEFKDIQAKQQEKNFVREVEHNRYINRSQLEQCFQSQNPQQAIIEMFTKYYPKEGQLKKAIENINQQKFRDLLDYLNKVLKQVLIDNNNLHIVKEIFQSTAYQSLLSKELENTIQDIIRGRGKGFQARYIFNEYIQIIDKYLQFSKDDIGLPIGILKRNVELLIKINPTEKSCDALFKSIQHQEEIINEEKLNKLKSVAEEREKFEKHKQYLQEENIVIDYQYAPAHPVVEEFVSIEENDYKQKNANPIFGQLVPYKGKGEAYKSVELFINNHFYMLREDYLRDFRQTLFDIQRNNYLFNRIDIDRKILQSVFIYYDLNLLEFEVTNKEVRFTVTMEAYDLRRRSIDWKKTNRLMPGALLAITDENLTNFVFATVIQKPDLRKSTNSKAHLNITILEDSIQKQVEKLNNALMTNRQILVFENKVFFETYIHYLKCLQNMDSKSLPFQSYFVNASTQMQLPKYLQNQANQAIYYNVNLKFDLHANQQQQGAQMQVNVLSDNWPPQIQESLDASQLKAIQLILKSEVSLIQGPPGTGKTFCGALGVRILQQNQSRWNPMNRGYVNHPILIVCYTNHALDQFLNHIMTFTNKKNILRIGGRCKDENLQECLLQNQERDKKINFEWHIFLPLKREIQRKLYSLLNLKDNIHCDDCEKYWPALVELIIFEYLKREDILFKNEISKKSKKIIVHMWLDSKKPRDQDANDIIQIEQRECRNQLIREPQQRERKFRAALRIISENSNAPVNLTEAQQRRVMENIYDGVDENERLDSDEEEDRRQVLRDVYDDEEEGIKFENDIRKYLSRLGFDKIKLEKIQGKLDANHPVWDLTTVERMTIQQRIFQLKYIEQSENFSLQLKQFQEMQAQLKNLYLDQDIKLMQTKGIIGVTVTGCAKYAEKLSKLKFKVMVIEEAAEVLEAHTIAIMSKNVEHLIMIGDHQQLKPKLESYYLETKYRTDVSLFERLVINELPYVTLQCQRRMKSNFADFIRIIYGNSYRDHEDINKKNIVPIKGMKSDLLFFNHKKLESNDTASASKSNEFEAKMSVKLAEYLIKNQYDPSQITLLTTYVKQALKIKKLVEQTKYRIKVQTVDNYQGEENDIIILSLVRSNKEHKIGFVGVDNRICVALSRARIGLYVFGNFEFIQDVIIKYNKNGKYSEQWLKLIDQAKMKNVLQDQITTSCQSHQQSETIKEVEDWRKVEAGGCNQTCNIRFPCGHICKQKCHTYDHKRENCINRCETKLPCGHQCSSMCKTQPCPPCMEKVEKLLPCGHTEKVPCSKDITRVRCMAECNKLLACGHKCRLKCSDDCKLGNCYQLADKTIQTCGHTIQIPCIDIQRNLSVICTEPCKEILQCGDKCQGTCGGCLMNLHIPCKQNCKRILICGHECQRKCGQPCGRCNQPCDYKCCTAICQKKCGDICTICLAKCQFGCEHNQCTLRCWEDCNIEACNQPCNQILKCGCPCLGLCGEECPNVCRNLLHDNDKDCLEIMFGYEDEENAKFYQLECSGKHIFEVQGLDAYFKGESEKEELRYFKCPKCQMVVSKSNRYNKYIKVIQRNMNQVKERQNINLTVTEDDCDDILIEINKQLDWVRTNGFKDKDNFLANQKRFFQQQIKNFNTGKSCDLIKHEFQCKLNQIKFYRQTAKLVNAQQLSNPQFELQKHVVIHDYLLNDNFYEYSTNEFWGRLECKIFTLCLYIDIVKEYCESKDPKIDQLSQEVEYSDFYLSIAEINQLRVQLNQLGRLTLEQIRQITSAVKDAGGAGHWFKCRNGHYFAIGDCGGAMEVSKCPDCGVKIGGADHALIADNQHAGEIDGSKFAAWSDQANEMIGGGGLI